MERIKHNKKLYTGVGSICSDYHPLRVLGWSSQTRSCFIQSGVCRFLFHLFFSYLVAAMHVFSSCGNLELGHDVFGKASSHLFVLER
ncbi:hypothetical protein M440DRAFT_96931 [Trichoderma longibrachiatum ATCC 18648]|uniref:Uncharacterized protein n=1 Tax=Trichoderma longibrachiatum ATCC 18648 TaxID=983965 RepID=A0A2T4BYY6_TRILO|nr:hypothetical protein M440DRAFT_96931 [Trichoderma longibrachiatum ATCC 18648]